MSTLVLGSTIPQLKVELPRAAGARFGLKVTLPEDESFEDLTAVVVLYAPGGDVEWSAYPVLDESDDGNTRRFYWDLDVEDTDVPWRTCDARLELRRVDLPQVVAVGQVRLSA